MQEMQRHAPELKKIQERYRDDKQRLNEETMKYYKEHNFNPLGACFPLLLQIPVFITLFDVLRDDGPFEAQLRAVEGAGEGFLFIPSLTEPTTGLVLVGMMVLYIGTQLGASLVSMVGAEGTQKRVMLFLPFVIAPFIITFPAGLLVYWITTNLWTVGQQYAVKKLLPAPAKDAAAAGGGEGRTATRAPPARRARARRPAPTARRALATARRRTGPRSRATARRRRPQPEPATAVRRRRRRPPRARRRSAPGGDADRGRTSGPGGGPEAAARAAGRAGGARARDRRGGGRGARPRRDGRGGGDRGAPDRDRGRRRSEPADRQARLDDRRGAAPGGACGLQGRCQPQGGRRGRRRLPRPARGRAAAVRRPRRLRCPRGRATCGARAHGRAPTGGSSTPTSRTAPTSRRTRRATSRSAASWSPRSTPGG